MLAGDIRRRSSELLLAIEDKNAPGKIHPAGETCKVDTQGWASHLPQVIVFINRSQTSCRPDWLESRDCGPGEASPSLIRVTVVAV